MNFANYRVDFFHNLISPKLRLDDLILTFNIKVSMVFNLLRGPKNTHSVFPKCRDNLLSTNQLEHDSITSDNFFETASVAERLRALFLNHSTISPLCLVWVRAPHWPHVRQAKFCLRVCHVVFLGVLLFSPTY